MELATYLLSDGQTQQGPAFLQRARISFQESVEPEASDDVSTVEHAHSSQTIAGVSEPPSPEGRDGEAEAPALPSVLSNLLKTSPARSIAQDQPHASDYDDNGDDNQTRTGQRRANHSTHDMSEHNPLLSRVTSGGRRSYMSDLEGQKPQARRPWISDLVEVGHKMEERMSYGVAVAVNPSRWDRKALWHNCVLTPVSCLPVVAVGLLLNILDALSYAGQSLASSARFSQLTNITQIEVVPFFHNMAAKITEVVGEGNPDAVIATTIVSFSLSAMMTGLVFYLMGRFKVGYVVGFIPRHILLGCIGGVGWFLVATGFEVSARLNGRLQYDLDTLKQLINPAAVPLWVTPLVFAIVLFYGQSKIRSKFFLSMFILAIPLIFYFFVFALDALDVDVLRDHGWIFRGPPSDEPWWYFYTLYSELESSVSSTTTGVADFCPEFKLVRWDAVAETIPAMLALTFFGFLHVPINVPALALNRGEDHLDLNKELRLHGYSNFLSGCFGSIQNYLVYANTVFFMRSGGNVRLAGYMLAAATFGVMVVGPSLIAFIPVMMVGTLVYDLGFELLVEALWLPRKRLKLSEYLTVVVIVLVMSVHDFVVGIGVGILLAFVSLVLQTSRVSAIRGNYSGDIVTSTVRRNPSQHHYLHDAGQQIYIVKLTGYLFFGTIVSVEEKVRGLLDDSTFAKHPIKFLILDMWHVTGHDFSAGEAFNTISRLLDNKGVILVLSGLDAENQLGQNLRAAGLGSDGIGVMMLPSLNSALESCENELLKTLYARQEELKSLKRMSPQHLDVPPAKTSSLSSFDSPFNSPRRNHLAEAAHDALTSVEVQRPSEWQSFKEPLRLMLQIFQGLSDQNEVFWFPATLYFTRREYPAGTNIFRCGEQANGFYLVERGIIRAEYHLPQGRLCESILAGTTCGELPFFSETELAATAVVERDCVVWRMDQDQWTKIQKEEPEVGKELLRISLKITICLFRNPQNGTIENFRPEAIRQAIRLEGQCIILSRIATSAGAGRVAPQMPPRVHKLSRATYQSLIMLAERVAASKAVATVLTIRSDAGWQPSTLQELGIFLA
uniref:Sulfate transporter n=1 Tax=Fusarium oxysporum (strain Fo5176) TaxID=660025 RepID=A0A0D2YFD2_FUSOF